MINDHSTLLEIHCACASVHSFGKLFVQIGKLLSKGMLPLNIMSFNSVSDVHFLLTHAQITVSV
jgi:hypothetical protein